MSPVHGFRGVARSLGRLRLCRCEVFEEGEESYWSEFAFCMEDELWDAHLEIACRDQASPKNSHDITSPNLAVPHEFRAEPETVYEHRHSHKLRSTISRAPHDINPPRHPTKAIEHLIEGTSFVRTSVECFDTGNGSEGMVY